MLTLLPAQQLRVPVQAEAQQPGPQLVTQVPRAAIAPWTTGTPVPVAEQQPALAWPGARSLAPV